QLEALQEENRRLRDKLLQMGAPIEQSPLSDSDKEQLLLGRSASGSMASLDGVAVREQVDVGDSSPGGARLEWDKASTSSLSEMSVACLQDRIMQMEETHYSTNEELQATLQELTDLQDQLTDLQLENERCGDEKSLLLESLCSQTEKLEECRSQNEHLRVLLFQQACPREQPREHHYVELLKASSPAHEEQQCLRGRVEQLESALEGANREAQDHQRDLGSLAHRVSLLQAALDATHPPLLGGGGGTRPPSRSTEDEQQQRKRAEEEEEEERQREQGLQEQLALAQREATRLSELLSQVQDETQAAHAQVVCPNASENLFYVELRGLLDYRCDSGTRFRVLKNSETCRSAPYTAPLDAGLRAEPDTGGAASAAQVSSLEQRVEQLEAEKAQLVQECEAKCQRQLEDKRQLRAQVTALNESLFSLARRKSGSSLRVDLLTTVRVANDFKTESQQDVERLQCDNQQLQEKLEALEAQLAKLKVGAPPEATPHGASPLRKPLGSRWGDLRPSSSSSSAQHSVRSLIESIENATKQAKGAAS
ncbi:cytospin-A, putative, partial [Ixodes scapularis]